MDNSTEMNARDAAVLERLFSGKDQGCDIPAMPGELSLAMAYVPYQQWEKPYEPEVGLSRGTIFPCLDKPFIGEEAVRDADSV